MSTLGTTDPHVLASRETHRRARRGENRPRAGHLWVYAVLMLGSLAFLTPFYFVLNGSLKTDEAVQKGDFVTPSFASA
jgi:ABC-type glycerol-3-phosphate transport system permease component